MVRLNTTRTGEEAATFTSGPIVRETDPSQVPKRELSADRVRLALESVLHRQYGTVTRARETASRCERHLEEARKLSLLADDAREEAVKLQTSLLRRINRPHWQSNPLNLSGRLVMIGVKVLTGVVSLYGSNEARPLTLASLASLAIMTVVLGTHIGTQLRRREGGDPVYLVTLATATLIVTTSLLAVYTYVTLGSSSAPFASTAVLVAIGSIFWSYQWHDPLADQIARAHDAHRSLTKAAERHLYHRDVTRFDKAEAQLRASLVRALNNDPGTNSQSSDYTHDQDLLRQLVEILIGPNPRHRAAKHESVLQSAPADPSQSSSGNNRHSELTERHTTPES